MKWLNFSFLLLIGVSFFSCVEDETVFVNKDDVITFDRQLFSIAEDETPTIEVSIRNFNQEDVSDNYEITFESSNPEVFTVSDEGVLSPAAGVVGQESSITVTAVLKTLSAGQEEAEKVRFISTETADKIIVGKVTISDNEALGLGSIEEQRVLAINGFEPRGVINNRVTQIDIDDQDITLNATFFNFKNEDIDNPTVTWSSNTPSVLEIDQSGKLTPITMGVSKITVSAEVDGQTVVSDALEITVADATIEEEPEEVEAQILGSGRLESNSFYSVSGAFQIITENDITRIVISDDYATGNVPDLVLYLSNDTNTNSGAQFISEDINTSGGQAFIVPDTVDVSNYRNVLLFCRRFNQRVGFGVINR